MRAKRTIALIVEPNRCARGAMSPRRLGCISGWRKYNGDLTSAVRFPHTDCPMKARTATVSFFPALLVYRMALAAGLILISLLVILPR